MRFKERNFPHPVLDPAGRDVGGSAFQAVKTHVADANHFYLTVQFDLNNETLLNLIESGKAAFVVHADCNAAFFRRIFKSNKNEVRINIPMTEIKRTLDLSFFICAEQAISDYVIKGMDPLYDGVTFQIQKGDILAYCERETVRLLDKDTLSRIGSIMKIRDGGNEITLPRIDYNSDKIEVSLPQGQFQSYAQLRTRAKAFVLSAVMLPVLIDAVSELLKSSADDSESEYASFLWYIVLEHKIDELRKKKVVESDSAYSIAQAILSGVSEKALAEMDSLLTGQD